MTILKCMGDLCEPGSTKFLSKRLKETNPQLVAATIEALDIVGAIENSVILEPYTTHPHPLIRTKAIVAIWRTGNMSAPSNLMELITARDESAVRASVDAVGGVQTSMNWMSLQRRPLLMSALQSEAQKRVGEVIDPELTGSMLHLPRLTSRIELDMTTPEEVNLAKAMAAFTKGEEARARDYVDEVLAKDPRNEGGVYLQQRLDRAAGQAKAIPKEILESTNFLNLISEESRRAKELQDTERLLRSYFLIFEQQMKILQEYVELGREYLDQDNRTRATDIAKLIVSQMQWTQDLNQKLGFLYMEQKNFEKAYEHLTRAFLSSGGEPLTAVNLAAVSLKLKKRAFAQILLGRVMDSSISDSRVKGMAREVAKDMTEEVVGENLTKD